MMTCPLYGNDRKGINNEKLRKEDMRDLGGAYAYFRIGDSIFVL